LEYESLNFLSSSKNIKIIRNNKVNPKAVVDCNKIKEIGATILDISSEKKKERPSQINSR